MVVDKTSMKTQNKEIFASYINLAPKRLAQGLKQSLSSEHQERVCSSEERLLRQPPPETTEMALTLSLKIT